MEQLNINLLKDSAYTNQGKIIQFKNEQSEVMVGEVLYNDGENRLRVKVPEVRDCHFSVWTENVLAVI